MNSLYSTLMEVLKQKAEFFSENGELLRNAVYEAAMKMDSNLIKLLYENEVTKADFLPLLTVSLFLIKLDSAG